MDERSSAPASSKKNYGRLRVAAAGLTVGGMALFGYYIYAVGFWEILEGIGKFGLAGFAAILFIYLLRLLTRAWAWTLAVTEPHDLPLKDALPAVIIGEALSSTIPLGIVISGTSKVVAVRRRIPLLAGFSSVATENLFYTLVTGIFLISGALVMLGSFAVDESLRLTINFLVALLAILLALGVVMVVRQWHFASAICEWIYRRGFLKGVLKNGRRDVHRFEDLIYGFYRKYPQRFLPICLLEAAYHALGIAEVWFILSRISDVIPSFTTAFLLESVSRLVTIIFKLIPFVIGVDEAGAQFVGETIGLAAGLGVTLAIIRKGRILFWAAAGVVLIVKRGLNLTHLSAGHSGKEN